MAIEAYPVFVDLDGTALEGGSVYLGAPNSDPEAAPVNLFYDAALLIAAPNPLTVSGGVIVRDGAPANVYAADQFYSIRVRSRSGRVVWYKPVAGGTGASTRLNFPVAGGPPGDGGPAGPADNTYTTLAALLASDPSRKSARLVPGPGETAPAGNFSNPTGVAGAWVRQEAVGVAWTPTIANAATRPVADVLYTMGISPRKYGAKGDAAADESTAVQRAIDECLSFNPPAPLRVDGYFRIDKPLVINRPVNSSLSWWEVVGTGLNAGFLVVGDVNMFDTTISYNGSMPVAGEFVVRGLNLVASTPTQASQTFTTGKFVNVVFDTCTWVNLKLMGTPLYAQGIRIKGCRAYYWQGRFWESGGAYDCKVEDFRTKFGGDVFRWFSASYPVLRAKIADCAFEGTGAIFRGSGISQLAFKDNYCEYNNAAALDFSTGGRANSAVSVKDNIFVPLDGQLADASFYEITWGATLRAFSQGNLCLARMHDTAGMTGSNLLEIHGDVAGVELWRGFKTGLTNSAFAGIGNVQFTDTDFGLVTARGSQWSSTRAGRFGKGEAYGPGEIQNGALVPEYRFRSTVDPVSNPGGYDNPYWTKGTRIDRYPAAAGEPEYHLCTVSGRVTDGGQFRTRVAA